MPLEHLMHIPETKTAPEEGGCAAYAAYVAYAAVNCGKLYADNTSAIMQLRELKWRDIRTSSLSIPIIILTWIRAKKPHTQATSYPFLSLHFSSSK
jgi:hypothetical protein